MSAFPGRRVDAIRTCTTAATRLRTGGYRMELIAIGPDLSERLDDFVHAGFVEAWGHDLRAEAGRSHPFDRRQAGHRIIGRAVVPGTLEGTAPRPERNLLLVHRK